MLIQGIAEKLKTERESKKRSMAEMASTIGLTVEAYRDLETYDDEITTCLSLEELSKLEAALEIDFCRFISPLPIFVYPISPLNDFAELVKDYLELKKMRVADFEESIGWEVSNVLSNPAEVLKMSVEWLAIVCEKIGVDWKLILPVLTRVNSDKADNVNVNMSIRRSNEEKC